MLIRKPDRKAMQERCLHLLPHRPHPGQLPPLRRITRADLIAGGMALLIVVASALFLIVVLRGGR